MRATDTTARRIVDVRCQLCGYTGPVPMGPDARRTIHGATFADLSGPCPECDTMHAVMVREDTTED